MVGGPLSVGAKTMTGIAQYRLEPVRSSATFLVTNVVLFQIGWFSCVVGAAHGWIWPGSVLALLIAGWHLSRAISLLPEVKLIALTLSIGLLWDSLLVSLGWLRYPHGALIPSVAPVWIVALWLLFATTLNVSLRWLKPRLSTALILGAIFGPLSYWGASRLGAVDVIHPVALTIALAAGWGAIMPSLMFASRVFDGFKEPASKEGE
ncbi:MAG: DUF2878 domain-containing protein [Burkholderiaceae bacterium]